MVNVTHRNQTIFGKMFFDYHIPLSIDLMGEFGSWSSQCDLPKENGILLQTKCPFLIEKVEGESTQR